MIENKTWYVKHACLIPLVVDIGDYNYGFAGGAGIKDVASDFVRMAVINLGEDEVRKMVEEVIAEHKKNENWQAVMNSSIVM